MDPFMYVTLLYCSCWLLQWSNGNGVLLRSCPHGKVISPYTCTSSVSMLQPPRLHIAYPAEPHAILYSSALICPLREVAEQVTGSLPFVHLSTECHCPPSHPVIDPNGEDTCIQHTGDLTNRGFIGRLNTFAHPPGFLNDFGATTAWISVPGEQTAAITVNLTQSLYEVHVYIVYCLCLLLFTTLPL